MNPPVVDLSYEREGAGEVYYGAKIIDRMEIYIYI